MIKTETLEIQTNHHKQVIHESLTYYHVPASLNTEAQARSAKPALLFLHGILGDGRTWHPYLTAFSQYDCYALTQSGFGKDSDRETLFDTDRHAAELIAFCQALNVKERQPHRQFTIIAWSYACHVVLLAMEKQRKIHHSGQASLFNSAILYELIVPSYGMSEADQSLFTRDITKMMSPIIKAYRRGNIEKAVDHFIAACKNEDSDTYGIANQSESIQTIKHDNAHTLQKLLTQVEPKSIDAEILKAIHQEMPLSILCGKNSRTIFQLSSKAGAEAIDQNDWIVPEADHLLPENDSSALIQIIKNYLR